ncbi:MULTISPECIES: hypothetical protein [unclassified Nonomuraea]|uniref:hypothetical protein n=1 Tax=unclassified Nonomuraea TaxID=2593643 RepID=UPI00373E2206
MTLPTTVPGIAFEGRGRVWYRPFPRRDHDPERPQHPNADAARAAALAGTKAASRNVTETLFPEEAFEAEQQLTMKLAGWKPTPAYGDIEFRARMYVSMSEPDLVRSERFSDARRAGRLETVLADDAVISLSEDHLSNITRASLWWLRQHLSQPNPDLSWETFDRHVRPLVAEVHSSKDDVERLAHILLAATGRISEEPVLQQRLLWLLKKSFDLVDWSDLAEMTEELERRTG